MERNRRPKASTNLASRMDKFNDIALDTRLHRAILLAQGGRLLPEVIPLNALKIVLDLGCSTGDWAFEMARRYPQLHIYGMDHCPKALEQAQARRGIGGLRQVELRQADFLQNLSGPDHYFDLLHMRNCATCILPQQWPQLIWNCTRVLKVSGWITFVDFELGEIASSACMELHRAKLRMLTRLKQNMDSTGMSFGALQRVYSILHREPFDEIGYTLHTADLGFMSGEAGQAFLALLLKEFLQYRAQIIQQRQLSEQRFTELFAQAEQELQAPDLCGWGMISSVYGRRSER
jgi:ubiquinone/menaquinone biosynthesis C-methylase UbiE